MTTATYSLTKINTRNLTLGAIGGLVGGVQFGMMMAMMGMMPMIGMLVRVESAFVGVLVHAAISAITGAIYGFFAVRFPVTWRNAILGGLLYGVIWWVLGGLILMPILLGMPAFAQFKDPMMTPVAWGSLVGHLIYGVILGIVAAALLKKGGQPAVA